MSFSVISKAPVLISWVSTAAEEKGTKKGHEILERKLPLKRKKVIMQA